MATVELNQEQADLLRSLELPTVISTDMDDDLWCDMLDRLLEEVQVKGFNDSFDGENDYGLLCSSVYDLMVNAER